MVEAIEGLFGIDWWLVGSEDDVEIGGVEVRRNMVVWRVVPSWR